MTVSSEITEVSYATDGVTTAFPVPFYFLANDHLRVWLYYVGTGVEIDLVLGSAYEVSGAGNPAGGTVTTNTSYPAGPRLRIERIVPITQETAYQRNDPFPERAHERALDKLTMICQQLAGFFGLLPGTTLRALLLGRNDVDGQGAYRARGNRIQDLGDPVAQQDAVTRSWLDTAITGVQAYAYDLYLQGRSYAEKLVAGVQGGYGFFRQPDAGAKDRTFQEKMQETRSIGDYDQSAWVRKRGLIVPDGAYNLAANVYLDSEIGPGVRYSGPGKFISLQSVPSLTMDFLIQAGTDSENNTIPNFIRRAIEVRRADANSLPYQNGYERTPNSTALGLAVQFMCEFQEFSTTKAEELTPYIVVGADYLCAMQYRDPLTARFGGIKGAVNDNNTTCFGTATAARALLRAYKVTGKTRYLNAARNAVAYFKVLANPNPVYQALYGETPIPAVAENAGFQGFCDRIQGSDSISITASDWNLVAAVFLKEMFDFTGDATLPPIYTAARDWHVYGVQNGLDYFALKNAAPSAHVSVTWPFFSGHTYADGAWHRLGEPAGTNTVGTDQIEYGLSSLYDLGYPAASVDAIYEVYRALVHADKGVTSFGDAYDGAICFPGFFRINSPNYGGSGGVPIDPATSRAFGGYYDVQGAGALLLYKRQRYPNDYYKSLPLVQVAYLLGALVDENFNTIWSAGSGYQFYTKGIIPIAKAGIGLIESLESVQ
ncbi:hypothetical protein [Achromobacter marplatensis]